MRWTSVPLQPGEVRITKHARAWSWIGKLGGTVAFVYLLALLRSSSELMSLYAGAAAGLSLVAASVAVNRQRSIASGAQLAFEEDHLVVRSDSGVTKFRRDEIAGGYFDGTGRLTLNLTSGAQLDFGCDVETATALLEEAGLSAGQRAVRLKLASWGSQHPLANAAAHAIGTVAAIFFAAFSLGALFAIEEGWLMHVIDRWPWWVSSGAMWLAASRLTGARSVLIGTDALIIRGAFTRRHVAMRDIASVEETELGVILALRDGTTIALPTHGLRTLVTDASAEDADARRALARRIHEALTRDRSTDLDPVALRRLERGHRSSGEWTAAMLGLAEVSGRYRERVISREALARTVTDAALRHEQRIGAALALSGNEDEHWSRIEIAAAASADPQLSRALRAAARGDVSPRLRIDTEDHEAEEEAAAEEERGRTAPPAHVRESERS